MSKASEQASRISVRLSSQLKATIERAAASRGQSLSQFLIATLAEGANDVLQHTTSREPSGVGADVAALRSGGFVQCKPPAHVKCAEQSFKPPVVISLTPYAGSRPSVAITFGL